MIKVAGCEDSGDMNRVWDKASDRNVVFFDVLSMHRVIELFAISQMCYCHLPERIVEYGTAMGGLTSLFGRWAYVTGAKVLSIDSVKRGYAQRTDYPKHEELLKQLPVELLDVDEYSQECYDKIQKFSAGYKTFFYCDGGNKPAEFRWCARILKPKDLLVTHDYDMSKKDLEGITLPPLWIETGQVTVAQAQRVIEQFGLETVFDDELRGGSTKTRILAVQLREDNKNGNSNSNENVASEKQLSQK